MRLGQRGRGEPLEALGKLQQTKLLFVGDEHVRFTASGIHLHCHYRPSRGVEAVGYRNNDIPFQALLQHLQLVASRPMFHGTSAKRNWIEGRQ